MGRRGGGGVGDGKRYARSKGGGQEARVLKWRNKGEFKCS